RPAERHRGARGSAAAPGSSPAGPARTAPTRQAQTGGARGRFAFGRRRLSGVSRSGAPGRQNQAVDPGAARPQGGSVWFQNRRAKWRRQEKLEVTSMKLQDSPILSFNRSPQATPMGPLSSSLPLETWLSPPVPSGTALQSLPGFVASPQSLPSSYTPPPFLNSPAVTHALQPLGAMGPPPPYQCGATFVDKFPLDEADPRNTSIAALRMKAKEHIQSIGKPWQTI
uniref:Retina and anterior neural fold homeobox n=1 Tax=Anas platyrhynchos platyrhynchos TaxID=8840 RepID=U3I1X5_ANAPP